MFFFISILSSIIGAAIFTHSYSQCLPDQKTLLLELKNELIFDSSLSGKLVQWNQTDECCNWYGVECDGAGHVISLQLDKEAISGGIGNSSTLFRLEYLEKLNLAYNEFNYTEIPRGIHNLSYLTHLNLSYAPFGGQVPLELLSLRRLVSLDISNDDEDIYYFDLWDVEPLKLEFPNLEMFLQNLTGLRELYLDGVDISSQKSEWSIILSSYLPNLTDLSLRDCGLSGPLDTSLSQLHSLSLLRLDGNNLSTPIPDFFANLSSLTTLSLQRCSLKGYFPKMIFQIPSLLNLDLSEIQLLSGTIPSFAHGVSLQSLVLRQTNFSGSLPNTIGTFSNLSQIDLSSCKFTGLIPSTFANLTQLVSLDLSNNFFTGSLSSTIFTGLSSLAYLYLGYNSFTGSIPQSLFALPSLQLLSLEENQFSGQVEEFPIVNASKLSALGLSSNRLEGPIPYSLFQLEGLGYLRLSNNMFSGIFQLEKFRSLPNIHGLELSDNNLSVDTNNVNSSSKYPQLGVLGLASCKLHYFPDFIKHSDVWILDLSNNRIAGAIPNWFWETQFHRVNLSSNLLTGLQKPFHISPMLFVLDLSSNQLQGELDPFLGITVLFLSLTNNSLSGTIPTSLCNANLQALDLSHNKLSGNIPPCLRQNIQIQVLNIDGNNISGHIPDSFSPNFWVLSLANNSLSGSIPTSLCNATQLKVLDLSHNKLSGNIPPCLLANMKNLEVFNIGRNNISGHIPDNFSPNCSLKSFDLNNNTLEGNFPKSIQNCNSLEFVNVGNNIINDSFPFMLPSFLRVIVLRSNRFHGEVRCHQSWPNIQIIDLSSNNFSGSLKAVNFSSWGAMMLDSGAYNRSVPNYLQGLYIGSYPIEVTLTMKGNEVNLVKIWPDFTAVDFSSNNFNGEIPSAIGDLRSLRLLNLSHNAFNGSIPKSFGKLGLLESLDLSVNQLTGTIPMELGGLTFLSTLNLSYNKLVGNIPSGRQLQTFSDDSFKGNPGLCLNRSCSNTDGNGSSPPERENVDPKEIEWEYVSAAVGFVVGLGSIVWLLLCCRSFREKYLDKIEDVVEERLYGISRRRRRARRLVRSRGRR